MTLGQNTLMEENNWQTCLQNTLNVFDWKYHAVKLGSPLGSNEVTCAVSFVWQCFGGSDKSKTLHTRFMRCWRYVRVFTVWARLDAFVLL